jgi:hypothetical protein
MDLSSKPEGMRPDLSTYTIDKYSAIVKYKTSYYSFVLPLRLGMFSLLQTTFETTIRQSYEKFLNSIQLYICRTGPQREITISLNKFH